MAKNELAAAQILQKIKAPDPINLHVRQTLVAYFANTKRQELADQHIALLEKDYVDSLDVLKLSVNNRIRKAIAAIPAGQKKELDETTRKEIDAKIAEYLSRYGESNRAARLYWAEWLMQSGRSPAALE